MSRWAMLAKRSPLARECLVGRVVKAAQIGHGSIAVRGKPLQSGGMLNPSTVSKANDKDQQRPARTSTVVNRLGGRWLLHPQVSRPCSLSPEAAIAARQGNRPAPPTTHRKLHLRRQRGCPARTGKPPSRMPNRPDICHRRWRHLLGCRPGTGIKCLLMKARRGSNASSISSSGTDRRSYSSASMRRYSSALPRTQVSRLAIKH